MKKPSQIYLDDEVGMKKVQNGGFAFHLNRPTAYDIMSKQFDAHQIRQTIEIPFRADRQLGVVVAKNSTFRERTAINLAWMRETGILSKYKIFWNRPKPDGSNAESYRSVSIGDIGCIILTLIFVMVISAVCLLFELILYAREKK